METASELNVHVLQDFHSKWAKYWLITDEASNLQIMYQRKVHNFSPSTDEIILVHCFCCDRKQKVITIFVAAVRMTASFCHSTFTCSCCISVPWIKLIVLWKEQAGLRSGPNDDGVGDLFVWDLRQAPGVGGACWHPLVYLKAEVPQSRPSICDGYKSGT